MRAVIEALERKTEPLAKKLEQKTISIPINLVTGIVMAIFALFIMLTMETQIPVGDNHTVNGRAFPSLLMWVMLICCAILIIKDVLALTQGRPIEHKTLNMLVEAKALIIFGILLATYFIASLSEMFVLGGIFCVLAFLIFFKCKKLSYYAIAITLAVAIWAAFYYGLKIRF